MAKNDLNAVQRTEAFLGQATPLFPVRDEWECAARRHRFKVSIFAFVGISLLLGAFGGVLMMILRLWPS